MVKGGGERRWLIDLFRLCDGIAELHLLFIGARNQSAEVYLTIFQKRIKTLTTNVSMLVYSPVAASAFCLPRLILPAESERNNRANWKGKSNVIKVIRNPKVSWRAKVLVKGLIVPNRHQIIRIAIAKYFIRSLFIGIGGGDVGGGHGAEGEKRRGAVLVFERGRRRDFKKLWFLKNSTLFLHFHLFQR
jgi:hypothetical protein